MFSKIIISSIGKTQKEYQEIESHYLKQIKTKISLQISPPLSYLSAIEQVNKESLALLKISPQIDYMIALDSKGTQFSSEEFSAKLQELSLTRKSIGFIIGGSHGLSADLKKSSDLLLSFSKFTLPHQVARIILFEQIYRAEAIFNGNKYHK